MCFSQTHHGCIYLPYLNCCAPSIRPFSLQWLSPLMGGSVNIDSFVRHHLGCRGISALGHLEVSPVVSEAIHHLGTHTHTHTHKHTHTHTHTHTQDVIWAGCGCHQPPSVHSKVTLNCFTARINYTCVCAQADSLAQGRVPFYPVGSVSAACVQSSVSTASCGAYHWLRCFIFRAILSLFLPVTSYQ